MSSGTSFYQSLNAYLQSAQIVSTSYSANQTRGTLAPAGRTPIGQKDTLVHDNEFLQTSLNAQDLDPPRRSGDASLLRHAPLHLKPQGIDARRWGGAGLRSVGRPGGCVVGHLRRADDRRWPASVTWRSSATYFLSYGRGVATNRSRSPSAGSSRPGKSKPSRATWFVGPGASVPEALAGIVL